MQLRDPQTAILVVLVCVTWYLLYCTHADSADLYCHLLQWFPTCGSVPLRESRDDLQHWKEKEFLLQNCVLFFLIFL